MQNFRALGAPSLDPRASAGWELLPQIPETAPPLRISGYAPELVVHARTSPEPESDLKSKPGPKNHRRSQDF